MEAFEGGTTGAGVNLPKRQGPSDEIDRLGNTFKEMAARIDTQMEALKASDQMRRELVANVSHDLRTPLATLQGYIETLLIKENQYTPEERRHYLEIAIRHCRRLNTLVSELLELARLESARMDLSPEPFDPRELIQDICQKFTLSAEQKEIELHQQFENAIPLVEADIALIERALENLIENALNYTPEKGKVSVTVSLETEVVIRISDTGPGIPEKDIPHIFNRFYRSDTSSNKNQEHNGLGLAITARILQLPRQRDPGEKQPRQWQLLFLFPAYLAINHLNRGNAQPFRTLIDRIVKITPAAMKAVKGSGMLINTKSTKKTPPAKHAVAYISL